VSLRARARARCFIHACMCACRGAHSHLSITCCVSCEGFFPRSRTRARSGEARFRVPGQSPFKRMTFKIQRRVGGGREEWGRDERKDRRARIFQTEILEMCVCVCVCVCARARVCVCAWLQKEERRAARKEEKGDSVASRSLSLFLSLSLSLSLSFSFSIFFLIVELSREAQGRGEIRSGFFLVT